RTVLADAMDLHESMWVRSGDVANGSIARLLDCAEADTAVGGLAKSHNRHLGELPAYDLFASLFVGTACRRLHAHHERQRLCTCIGESSRARDELAGLLPGDCGGTKARLRHGTAGARGARPAADRSGGAPAAAVHHASSKPCWSKLRVRAFSVTVRTT